MMNVYLFATVYTILEFLNFSFTYRFIFRCKFKSTISFRVITLTVFCLLHFVRINKGIPISLDAMNIVVATIIPLCWVGYQRKKWLQLYPIVVLATSIVNCCGIFAIALAIGKRESEILHVNKYQIISELSAILLVLVIYIIRKKSSEDNEKEVEFTKFQYIAIFIGTVCCSLITGTVQWIIEGAGNANIPKDLYTMCGFAISVVSVIFVIISVWQGVILKREMDYKRQNEMYENFMRMQEDYIKMLIDKDKQLRHFRHDMHVHMTALRGYCEESKSGEMLDYLNAIQENSSFYSSKRFTGNTAIDAVLGDLLYEAQEEGIQVEWQGSLLGERLDSVFDICTIYSNLIKNAIEQCMEEDKNKDRKIKLALYPYEDKIYLYVKNTCTEKVDIKKNNELVTTKKDKKKHGLGSQNVKKTVEKYSGTLKYRCENNWFEAEILL